MSWFSAVGSFGGSALSGIQNIIGSVAGLLKTALSGVLQFITGTIGLLDGAIRGAAIGIAAAVAGIASAVLQAVKSTAALGREINTLRLTTGLGGNAAGSLLLRGKAFGLGAEDFEGAGPLSMRGAAFGVRNMRDPRFLESLASRYQSLSASGPLGQSMARNLIGQYSPGIQQAALLPVNRIREQGAFAERLQRSLGISGQAVSEFAQNLDLVRGKFSLLGQLLLVKIGSQVLPAITTGLEKATNFIANNSEAIGGFIERGMRAGLDAAIALGRFLYVDAPDIFFGFTKSILTGIVSISEAVPGLWDGFLNGLSRFQAGIGVIGDWVSEMFTKARSAFDEFANSSLWSDIKSIAGGLGISFGNPSSSLSNENSSGGVTGLLTGGLAMAAARKIATTPQGIVGGAIAYGGFKAAQAVGLIDPNESFVGWNRDRIGRIGAALSSGNANNYDEWKKGDAAEAQSLAISRARQSKGGILDGLSNFFGPTQRGSWANGLDSSMGGAIRGGAGWVNEHSRSALQVLESLQKAAGSTASREKGFGDFIREIRAPLQETARNTSVIANNTAETANRLDGYGENIIARALQYEAEDSAMNLVRNGR